jgi:SAM-dependent methyltransferase
VESLFRETAHVKLCKIYSVADGQDADPLWQELLVSMCPDWKSTGALHRKYWEWGLGLYGLHKLGFITPDARALGVGAGLEWPLFYLANRVRRVDAIDLYSAASHFRGPDPTVAEQAAKIAPFPYREESLIFQKMDALDLRFDDDTFDFVFSFSSIEHFGGHAGASLSMHEIARVLKPGGVAAIATEIVLDGPRHPEFFFGNEIEPCFVGESGMEFVEPLDLHVDDGLITNPVQFDFPPGFEGYTGPHTSVHSGHWTFTSIEFFLRKPRDWKPASRPTLARLALQRRAWYAGQRAHRYGWYMWRVPHYAWSVALRWRWLIPGAVRRRLKKLFR